MTSVLLEKPLRIVDEQPHPDSVICYPLTQLLNMLRIWHTTETFYIIQPLLITLTLPQNSKPGMWPICTEDNLIWTCLNDGFSNRFLCIHAVLMAMV